MTKVKKAKIEFLNGNTEVMKYDCKESMTSHTLKFSYLLTSLGRMKFVGFKDISWGQRWISLVRWNETRKATPKFSISHIWYIYLSLQPPLCGIYSRYLRIPLEYLVWIRSHFLLNLYHSIMLFSTSLCICLGFQLFCFFFLLF